MLLGKISTEKKYIVWVIGLLMASLTFPKLVENIGFDIIVKIREAAITGDSGHLILASAFSCFLFAILNSLVFLCISRFMRLFEKKYKLRAISLKLLIIGSFVAINILIAKIYSITWESVTTIVALMFLLKLAESWKSSSSHFIQEAMVSVQVFFAFQWLNIMPIFSMYHFGKSDIPLSIKITGMYVNSTSMLNFIGFSFFLPFVFSALLTTTLFRSYAQNIIMVSENFQKERELQIMKSKVLENRIYQEINLLAHDLKTPLVTIRGLNSLLTMTKDEVKLETYSQRIENAVVKMNEMVSSFLYGSSRQLVSPEELINYIQAQIPMEDDKLKIEIDFDEYLPQILVNKVRVVRAIINILENAIVAPYRHAYKHIVIEVRAVAEGLRISISDNGIGIAPSMLHRIWEVGYSTGHTSGLGLPFAKQIIEENEGTVEVESELNQGTTVFISFPVGYES
jgi:anti-sigma regulatory factor (Ser/Thr protein kinase)